MKILLRLYGGKYYVWKNAKWEGGYYKLLDNDDSISETSILAVTEDERIGYVQCAYCGELVENNPEAIEAHYAKLEAQKNCMKCDKLVQFGDKMNAKKTFKANEDGTYTVEEAYDTKLGCRMSYYTENIHSERAKINCKFALCRRKGVRTINDTFVKYPGLFEKQITVDTLTAKKYVFDRYSNGFYEYDLKMRGTLKACVNENGIVDHFILYVRGWAYTIYYSDKYKKLFYHDWSKYGENLDFLNDTKMQKIIEKISQLYEEAKVNE